MECTCSLSENININLTDEYYICIIEHYIDYINSRNLKKSNELITFFHSYKNYVGKIKEIKFLDRKNNGTEINFFLKKDTITLQLNVKRNLELITSIDEICCIEFINFTLKHIFVFYETNEGALELRKI